jgi:DNA-binding response OmpR family regulator
MSSGMDYGEKSLELGADGFILKPYIPDDLVALIKKNLE